MNMMRLVNEFETDLAAFYGTDRDEAWLVENHDPIRREAVRLAKQHVRAVAHYEMALGEREIREKIDRARVAS